MTTLAIRQARGEGVLVSRLWDRREYSVQPTEPMRALLFMSRQQAREWCRVERARLQQSGHERLQAIRLSPVRVVEEVRRA